MISVSEAKSLIFKEATSFKKTTVLLPLQKTLGRIIASNLKSKCDSPPFDQSAMDGYALRFEDCIRENKIFYKHDSENSAGTSAIKKIKEGTAIRIFTGAKVPSNANVVIPQENVSITQEGILETDRSKLKPLDNIRTKGSQFRKSETILHKGDIMNAPRIALAASAGFNKLNVVKAPTVSVIVSGNELIPPGKPLSGDKIYESNSLMLTAVLEEHRIQVKGIYYVKDQLKQIKNTIQKALKQSDIVLISGGISVGKYDLVKTALEELNTKTIFHKIKQKPGKPLYFGKNKTKYVFGLPGNPAASLTCYYEYVLPFIKLISGNTSAFEEIKSGTLSNSFNKKPGLTHFLKGYTNLQTVTILPDQESYKLTSFAPANCLVIIPEEITELKAGDKVNYHLI